MQTNLELSPVGGWKNDKLNLDVSKSIYDLLMPYVNDGNLSNLSFTSGSGCFEDELGNIVLLTFVLPQSDDGDIEYLGGLNIGYSKNRTNSKSDMLIKITEIEERFNLKRVSSDS